MNSVGAMMIPCLTPVVMGKPSEISTFTLTVSSMLVCIALTMLITSGGTPFMDRTFHRAFKLTVSMLKATILIIFILIKSQKNHQLNEIGFP